MAVEIKELIIRAVVSDGNKQNKETVSGTIDQQTMQAIVQQCSKEILKIIERKNNR